MNFFMPLADGFEDLKNNDREEYLTKIQALIKNKNVISKMHSLLKQFYNSLKNYRGWFLTKLDMRSSKNKV